MNIWNTLLVVCATATLASTPWIFFILFQERIRKYEEEKRKQREDFWREYSKVIREKAEK